ncbi:hypothetical protein Q5H93_06835 [Hymenobacter sp. ASUV-10]|uniref:Uncharacterized protein n=1 Tax=Hymenobacter aranciens TaxID=3063996 RepID=A0ABT9B8E0_9BACT|nr:hypothetical protein [Hymenobacter sp. ASUV-10]MDO7874442.1 hypothetical protein [Hymenobacter sp. ASUV-10]
MRRTLRPLLACLLLLNYLLVVGAGLRVGRPEAPAFSAARPYVHNKACQQRNYLHLDCFEQCNGNQSEVKTKLPAETALHFLAQLKGLDVHCAFGALLRPRPAGPSSPTAALLRPAPQGGLLPLGFGGTNYPPPRRG